MSTPSGVDRAPEAPGRLGEAVEPEQLQDYLARLETWLHARRRELDRFDAQALAHGRGEEVAADMALALALWKAIGDRVHLLAATFDAGRLLAQDREQMAALIWGRLDGATLQVPGGLSVSLPEACRLADALAAQVRSRLELLPEAARDGARIRDLRAQVARLEDQVGLEPDAARDRAVHRVAALAARLQQVEDRAARGADVAGLLGPLELAATTQERDLIVAHAQRRRARELRDDLAQRAMALSRLADRCVAAVAPAPHYAVPDVTALGPVPAPPAEVESYLGRLERVSAALAWAQERYAAALTEHEELVDEFESLVTRARAAGVDHLDELSQAERIAREVLDRRPTPMGPAQQLVTTYRAWLEHFGEPP